MRLEQLNTRSLLEHTAFIKEGLEAVCATGKQYIPFYRFLEFLHFGIYQGNVGIWIQFNGAKPVGVYVICIGEDSGRFAEFVVVYNLPIARPTRILNEVGVTWAKGKGATTMRAYDPMGTPVSERRLRKYGFNKKGEFFERVI